MIHIIDPNERRILKYPAVHPCESISPTTLLSSLITLSKNITNYHSKFFPTHKKIIREVIRQVEILIIFFQEIQENTSNFTKLLILSLSELHFALQKIKFLLQDCTRNGAKLYILMKSHFVANQFRLSIRSVATALDVLPFDSLELSKEVKELVELLTKQAQKSKLEIDPSDECAMERVLLILNQFENEYEPEKRLIKGVMDHLSILNWSDCDDEVSFFEDEISKSDEKDKEIPLFCNLMGFICYCRGVIFDIIEQKDQFFTQSDDKLFGNKVNFMNIEDFRCPISLELMMDPMIVSTGQTYDRSSIEKWLKQGKLVCPKTGERLTSSELVPNVSLKRLIHQFCLDNGVSISKMRRKNKDLSKKIKSFTPCARQAMRFLASFLAGRLRYGTYEQKNKAAYEVKLLTRLGDYAISILVEVGIVSPLLNLLTSSDPTTQEIAIGAILKMSTSSIGQKMMFKEGGLMLIVLVLRRGVKMESRQMAAATIFYLSSSDKYRNMIGSTRITIPALVELIKDGSMSAKKNALSAILALLIYHGNHERAVDADTVPVLLDVIASGERSDLLTDSLPVLASLAETMNGTFAILQNSCLPLITELLKSSTDHTVKEYCVLILLLLCTNGGAEVVAILAREFVLMASLYPVAVNGSSQASRNARTLIRLLQNFHESKSLNLATAASVGNERILHAI